MAAEEELSKMFLRLAGEGRAFLPHGPGQRPQTSGWGFPLAQPHFAASQERSVPPRTNEPPLVRRLLQPALCSPVSHSATRRGVHSLFCWVVLASYEIVPDASVSPLLNKSGSLLGWLGRLDESIYAQC